MAGAERRLAPFVAAILASGYDNGPAAGPGSRGFHRPRGFSFLDRRDGSRWSGCLRERVDALPRGRDRFSPWPGRLDFQAPFPSAADQPAGGVQHAVAQRLGLGFGQVAVQGQELEPGEQDLPGHRRGQPRGVDPEVKGREMAQAGILAGADRVLDPGLDPVRDVDVGGLAQPASGVRGPVRGPQGVPPAVPGLEQGQLRAWMGPLAAREDPHRRGPGPQLVPASAVPQQPGQLGDVRFFDPARPVRAGQVRAGVIGAALADLPAAVDRGLPGLLRDQPQRRLLPLAQRPPDRVRQLVPAAGGQRVQALDQGVTGPGAVAGDHQLPPEPRRDRGDRRVQQLQVIRGGVAARRAAAQHPGQRLPAGVICSTALRILMAGAGKRRWGCRCGCSGRVADWLWVGGGALPTGRCVAGLHPGAGAGTVGASVLARPSGRTAGLTLGGVVLTVNGDGALVERQLAGGELGCPLCGGALGGWGHARPRPVRMAEGPDVVLAPRRSRCPGCGATHVLLPAWCLSRRADEGAVIGSALQAAAAGAGHRTIAAGLGRPASTVRGWLRRFAARAEAVRAFFTVLLARTSPDPVMPAGAAGPVAAAVSAIAGAAAAVAQRWPRLGTVPVWTAASAASGGLLIAPGWPGAGRYTS